MQVDLVPFIMDPHQGGDDFIAALACSRAKREHLPAILLRRAETVNAGNAGNNDDIAALQKSAGGRMSEFVDLVVNGRIFFNVGIALREVCFGLIIIIVADEILHRVTGKEFFELAAELGRQDFVGRDHQRRQLDLFDHLGRGIGLTGTGHPEQGLVRQAFPQTADQAGDRPGLVA